MRSRTMKVLVGVLLVLIAAQLIRPDRRNPPIDPNRTIEAQLGAGNGVVAILDRSCGDCHSNATAWPWYTGIAPLSWLMAYGVAEGRKTINFSEWAGYAPDLQHALLAASCQAASSGRMPGAYATLKPETRLSAQDVETICAASRAAPANSAPGL
jgi:hypothetical protein